MSDQPFSNVWQGSYDALSEDGVVGDGRSEFYAVDRNGERKASGLIVAGDIAATVLDSVTQFAGAPAVSRTWARCYGRCRWSRWRAADAGHVQHADRAVRPVPVPGRVDRRSPGPRSSTSPRSVWPAR